MTRWHTDRPVPPIAPVRPLPSASTVTMFRSDRAARASLRNAQALYRRKLREWAKGRLEAGNPPPSEKIDAMDEQIDRR